MKRYKKPFILLVILGILIAGIAAFFILNSTPDTLTEEQKEEAVAQILGRKPNLEDPDVKTGDTSYSGEKLSFSYPARAAIYEYEDPSEKNDVTTIESFSFDIENPRLILNYTAEEKAELKSLKDIPAVKLRDGESRGYTSEEFEIEGASGMSYMKKEGGGNRAEHSGFILKDGILYTISITGASLEDVSDLFDQIIDSAEFK